MKIPLTQIYGKYIVWFSINAPSQGRDTYSITGIERYWYNTTFIKAAKYGDFPHGNNEYIELGYARGIKEYKLKQLLRGINNYE